MASDPRWNRTKPGLYFHRSSVANGEIFRSPEPLRRWAWAVYHKSGCNFGVVQTLASALYDANAVIVRATLREGA